MQSFRAAVIQTASASFDAAASIDKLAGNSDIGVSLEIVAVDLAR